MGISDWSSDGALPICALIFKGYAAISNCVAEDFRARHGKCCSLQAQTEEAGFQAGVAVGDRKPPLGDAAGHRRRRNSFERLPRPAPQLGIDLPRSEEHTSELQSLMRISYAVFCLNNTKNHSKNTPHI